MQRCQPLEITNLEVFFWTSTLTYPTEFADATPSRKISFLIWTPYPPAPTAPSSLSVTSIGFILIQSNSCLNRNNKETTLFFLFTKTCITQENEARNHYTSIRSQMILEFWNIWSLNLSFCGQLIKTSSYPGVLVTRTGEQEIGSVSGRLPNNPGELAYTLLIFTFILNSLYPKYDQLQISAYSYNAESLVIKVHEKKRNDRQPRKL